MRILLIGLASLMVLLQGCSRHVVDESQLAQVQTVAVVMYSVPETIVMDARKPKDITDDKDSSGLSALSLAGDLLGGTAKKPPISLTRPRISKKRLMAPSLRNYP